MAKRKANRTSFKKGHTASKGNKGGGRPRALVPEVIQLKQYNRNQLTELVSKYSNYSKIELDNEQYQEGKPIIDLLVIKVMLKAHEMGDHIRTNWIFEQLAGKLPNETKVEVKQSFHTQLLEKLEEMRGIE